MNASTHEKHSVLVVDDQPQNIDLLFSVLCDEYKVIVAWITENGLPYKVAFDHDLGQDVANENVAMGMSKRKSRMEKKGIKDGKDAANWMVDYCLDNKQDVPLFTIQSANPTGADNIRGLLQGAIKHINKK